MARLPEVGGDQGSWGEILNDFLLQSMGSDGTLNAQSDIDDAKGKADSAIQSVNGKTGNAITLSSTDVVAEPEGLSVATLQQIQAMIATAVSGLGSDENPIAPAQITQLTLSGITQSQVQLSWAVPSNGGTAITGYSVEYQVDGTNTWTAIGIGAVSTYTLAGLSNLTTYDIRVAAVNTRGTGAYSTVQQVTTTPPLPAALASYNFDQGSGLSITDTSGNGNDLTITAPTGWSTEGHTGGALDGGGSATASGFGAYRAGFTTLTGTSAVSIAGWVKPTAVANTDNILFGFFDNPAVAGMNNTEFAVWQNRSDYGTNGVVQVYVRTANGLFATQLSSAFVTNQWTYVALTYDGSTLALYVNGVLTQSTPATGALTSSASVLTIGSNAEALIDDVRVYTTALSATQVGQLMNIPVS